MNSGQKHLLAALAAASDGVLEPVQIQKAMFILSQEAVSHVGGQFYKFVPYNYGPFSKAIYSDLAVFEDSGWVTVDHNSSPKRYIITKSGMEQRNETLLSNTMESYVPTVVNWVKGQSFSQLLNSIYKKYPDFAVNSVFNK